jgi:hypothetical protein
MPRYLVESYAAVSVEAFENSRRRARVTAESGSGLTYVDTTYLPDDETVMHLFDAPSAERLEDAARRAGLEFERIVEAVNEKESTR